MIAVIFEVIPVRGQRDAYLDLAARMRPLAEDIPGFISIERFQSLSNPDRLVSLSYWKDAPSLAAWRMLAAHRAAQRAGRDAIFADYRLRVAEVIRDYGLTARDQAPADSRALHG